MFWTILLYIYLGTSILTVLLSILLMIDAAVKLKRKYPDFTADKPSKISSAISWIRFIIMSLFPIINIILVIIIVLKWDDLVKAVIEKVEDKLENKEIEN